jgi:hypothetical protein
MPSRSPWASNSPPADEPFEIGADVWNRRPASTARFDEMIPSARLSSNPWGAPTVNARSPTLTSAYGLTRTHFGSASPAAPMLSTHRSASAFAEVTAARNRTPSLSSETVALLPTTWHAEALAAAGVPVAIALGRRISSILVVAPTAKQRAYSFNCRASCASGKWTIPPKSPAKTARPPHRVSVPFDRWPRRQDGPDC